MVCADLVSSKVPLDRSCFLNHHLADSVLVILDRNIDLIPMLSHSWTYQALVHDVLEMKLNRVSVNVSPFAWLEKYHAYLPRMQTALENGKMQKKSYDFDTKDFFWAKHAGQPFPTVAEAIDDELARRVGIFRLTQQLEGLIIPHLQI